MKYNSYDDIPTETIMRMEELLAKQARNLVKSLVKNGDWSDERFTRKLLCRVYENYQEIIDELKKGNNL